MKLTLIALSILLPALILITGFWDHVSQLIFPNVTWGLYDKSFFENLLVEIHGAFFDLILVGVILYWFEKRRDKNKNIKDLKNNLEDLRFYHGNDAPYKTYGELKRLLALDVKSVNIPEAKLNLLNIDNLELKNSNLIAVNFSDSTLNKPSFSLVKAEAANFINSKIKHAKFKEVNFRRAKFINAQLKGIDFRSCQLEGANFLDASLQSANFSEVDCKGVKFKGANLRSANFIGATNLTAEMLLEAKDISHIKVSEGLILDSGGIEPPSE